MKKLKDKLIHWFGGYTEEDIMVRTRPQRVEVSRFCIRTLKLNKIIRRDMLEIYPDYQDHAKKDMAYMIGDKMMEEKLIEFGTSPEDPETIIVTAMARIVVPINT